eukprot:3436447-Rhodomonas_salina.1
MAWLISLFAVVITTTTTAVICQQSYVHHHDWRPSSETLCCELKSTSPNPHSHVSHPPTTTIMIMI